MPLLLLLVVLICLPFGPARAAGDEIRVERWGVFETSFAGPADGNPFVDVELRARFVQAERSVEVEGFYDGGGVYRLRFSPDREGLWQFETASNRAELHGRSGQFVATPPSAANRGPVAVAHTFHFAYADGTPFRQIGTTAYAWVHRGPEQFEETLRTLAASPFNKVRMCLLPPGPSPRHNGVFPFEGTPPRNWDTRRFNPAFFRHFEESVRRLGALGIEADLILFNPYEKAWGFNSMSAEDDDRFVRYAVARLAAFRNVWWSLCNEWDFHDYKVEADWDRIFQLIARIDPYRRLLSIHNGFVFYNHTQPWVSHASVQHGTATLDPERAVILRDAWRKPVVYDEVRYEGNHNRRWGQLSGEEMVLRFWNGLVAGTYVGHGEVLAKDGSEAWIGGGSVLHGESLPRLQFLQRIWADAPPEGIEPIDKWQERRTGGKVGDYYLVYLGTEAPREWPLVLHERGLSEGLEFSAEVIDTWAMTITPVEGVFTLARRDTYTFGDRAGRAIPLPGRPYQAIRLRRIGGAAETPTVPERERN